MARQIFETDDQWDDGGSPSWRQRQTVQRQDTAQRRAWRKLNPGMLLALGFILPMMLWAVGAAIIVCCALLSDAIR